MNAPSDQKISPLYLSVIHLKLIGLLAVGPMVIPNLGREFHLSALEIKAWTTALLLGAGLSAFGAGALSDALGRRFLGILGSIVLIVVSLITGFGWSYWIIIAMAPLLGILVSLLDVNMDGLVGAISKGRSASGLFARVLMVSCFLLAGCALFFGVLVTRVEGSWRWFFFSLALLNVVTLILYSHGFPRGTARSGAFREVIPHFKAGFKLLKDPPYLCVVALGMFTSSTLAAVVTDGPSVLSVTLKASGWIYGGVFAGLALMGALGYLTGLLMSKRFSPGTQTICGSVVMAASGAAMLVAMFRFPGDPLAIGIPMATSFFGNTLVTAANLALATDMVHVDPSVGASMITIFKRLVPMLLSMLLVGLTLAGLDTGGMAMSISVLSCGSLALIASILCVRLKVDPIKS